MPTLNDVLAGSLAQAVQVQQIIDAMKGTPSKGVPVSFTALSDTTNYALTVQNDDATNSRALLVLKSDGTTLIAADATGVTLGSPVNLPAGSITGSTALANASVTNAKLGPDVARANLLTNGGFEIWQRGNGPFTTAGAYAADRWRLNQVASDTFSVSPDTTNVDTGSATAAACTFVLSGGAGASNIGQSITDIPQLNGRTVTISIRVRTSTASAVRVALNDGTPTYSSYHTGSGTYQTLTVSKTIAASTFGIQVYFAASCTAYIDNANLVVGSQAADYVPLHPADDLARCQRYYETYIPPQGGFATVLCMLTTTAIAGFNYKVTKPVTPTVTFTNTWAVTIQSGTGVTATSMSASLMNTTSFQLAATVASGLTAGQAGVLGASSGSPSIAIEANP